MSGARVWTGHTAHRSNIVRRVTLVGVVHLADAVLFGGDSVVSETTEDSQIFATAPAHKLFRSTARPSVAFGFSGSVALGMEFQRWFDRQAPRSWDDFEEDARKELARINRQGREHAAEAGSENPPQLVETLIGGYLQDESRVCLLETDGLVERLPQGTVGWIGDTAAKQAAMCAWATAALLEPQEPRRWFAAVLQGTISTLPLLGGEPVTLEVSNERDHEVGVWGRK